MGRTAEDMREISQNTRFSSENQPENKRGKGVAAELRKQLKALGKGDAETPIVTRLLQFVFSPGLETESNNGIITQPIEPQHRLAAIREILDRMEGKPRQAMEHTGGDGQTLFPAGAVTVNILGAGAKPITNEDDLPEDDEFFKIDE